jgi:putative transposase
MREENLRAKSSRRFRVTTRPHLNLPASPNHLGRRFRADNLDQCWIGDITYVWTREGWLYFAALLDLASRRVVGWSMSARLTKQLTLSALSMAIDHRRPGRGLLHHSDQGVQYACHSYRQLLQTHGMVSSMSRRGEVYDNAVAESFFSTLKKELVHQTKFATRTDARRAIFDYVEVFYNRQRRHSTLGYLSPAEFEASRQVT